MKDVRVRIDASFCMMDVRVRSPGAKEPSKVRSRVRLDLILLCWVVLQLNT